MIAPRLIRLIETHSEQLAHSLLRRLQTEARFAEIRKVPAEELEQRAHEVYQNLSAWLLTKTEAEVRTRYMEIGARRASQGVAISQLIAAILLTKQHLWEYLRTEALADRPVEIFQELDLLQAVDQFYDRAVFYAALGHEKAAVHAK